MSKKESPKKQTPKKEVTVKTYLEDSVNHNHVQTQGCCCGKHLPEPNSQHQESQLKHQKRISLLPQYPKNSYQYERQPFHKKPALHQAPDLPRYSQPVKLIRKQEQEQGQKQQGQKVEKDKNAKSKSQEKPQQKMQLPRNPTQEQIRRYRLERFYAECEAPLETQEQFPSWPQYPYTSNQNERDENQGKPSVEKDWIAPKKETTDLPRFPVAAYGGRRPFKSQGQLSTSRIQPPQEKPEQQSRSSDNRSLIPESSRSSSTSDAESSAECESVFGIPK
ncbi:uncharacterized protein ASPGLDRAFT_29971 [Aspergillus glaucus CBS 516.65]|uniref:Uncharacterized protein n=1 Tax=Aspergillus glaucus CBS 516.65 TaxID=1160497 RepID=A0A1L9V621_ASPGL|nr:hypothetical protein ASPGLDRAFT_29971 [Aspergillus glaucus CBS 516.65]OJJ79358.1 hypothetical protein ASPGLDRAFT_29971 [Aspergillus glaucus CBS 516.65]